MGKIEENVEEDVLDEFDTPERVSIWSVKSEWIDVYYFAFFAMVLMFVYWRTLYEFFWSNPDEVVPLGKRVIDVLQDTAPVVIIAAVASMILVMWAEFMLKAYFRYSQKENDRDE